MKLQRILISFAMASAVSLGAFTTAVAETIRTPLSSPVRIQGTSSGDRSSRCGFIPNSPNHQLVVSEPLVSLRFVVEGQGEPTLMIQNSQGRSECVMADRLSQGTIELPGAWERGNYSIFIGGRNGGSYSYTLSVSQD